MKFTLRGKHILLRKSVYALWASALSTFACSVMLKTILEDNDGVLVDAAGLYFQACRETFGRSE